MLSTRSLFASLLAVAPAFSHILMTFPPPFGNPVLDPLTKANFPCQVGSNPVTGATVTDVTAGESIAVIFKGTAVHNGGSCQISISLDESPNPKSVWKVIHTVQGGCPGQGTQVVPLDVVIPPSVPSGPVSMAWTWFPVSSLNAEMYMNCASLKVEGGASDSTAFNALPDLFIANLDDTCLVHDATQAEAVPSIPNAGDSVETRANGAFTLRPPVGAGCGPTGTAPATSATGTATSSTSSASATGSTSTTSTASETTPATTTAMSSSNASSSAASTPPAASASGVATCDASTPVLCNGEKQYGICNINVVGIWQDVAAGTKCVNGAIVAA